MKKTGAFSRFFYKHTLKKIWNMPLHKKIIVNHVLLILVPVVVILSIVFSIYSNDKKNDILKMTNLVNQRAMQSIDSYLKDIAELTKQPLYQADVMALLRKSAAHPEIYQNDGNANAVRPAGSSITDLKQINELKTLTVRTKAFKKDIYAVFIFNLYNMVWWVSDAGITGGYRPVNDEWFRRCLELEGDPYIMRSEKCEMLPLTPSSTKYTFSVSRAIKDVNNGTTIIGVIRIVNDISFLRTACSEIMSVEGERILILMISVDNYKLMNEEMGAEETKLMMFIVRRLVEETMEEYDDHLICTCASEVILAVAAPDNEPDYLIKIIQHIYKNLTDYTDIRFVICTGCSVKGTLYLRESYASAILLLKYRFYKTESTILSENDIQAFSGGTAIKLNTLTENLSNEMTDCIELGNYFMIERLLVQYGKDLYKIRFQPEDVMKSFIFVFTKMQMQFPKFEEAMVEICGNGFSYQLYMDLFTSLDKMVDKNVSIYTKIVKKLSLLRKGKEKKLIEVVKEYVANHYQDDISLNKVGDVRVKTYRVGEMVGYDDPTYFSKVFKKIVGISPSEYRNST